jgi:hypothetical protein
LKGGEKLRAYFGSPISPNITQTPDGFYICKNVPIARTGWYQYLRREVGAEGNPDEMVDVYRSPEEVFNSAAIASFNGKPVTNEHPPDWVTPGNAKIYMKGSTQNIRRSETEPDLLLADLIVYDADLIRQIQENQKREVSCGYDCTYVDNGDGTYSQKDICGNHVAVVQAGRAGDRVAIKDSEIKKGEKNMPSKIKLPTKKHSRVTDILASIGLKHFATDADPEEIMDAVDAMAEEKGAAKEEDKKSKDEEIEKKEESKEEKDKKSKDEEPGVTQKVGEKLDRLTDAISKMYEPEGKDEELPATGLEAKIDRLTSVIEELVKSDKMVHKQMNPEDAIDEVIKEIETPEEHVEEDEDIPDEEEVTIAPEDITDEAPISKPEERPKNPLGSHDDAIALLKQLKPAVAKIQGKENRKLMSDALMNSVKTLKGLPIKKSNNYSSIIKGQQKIAQQHQSKDATQKQKEFDELGKKIAEQYNPHYKKEGK